MSTLIEVEKICLEKVLGMGGGYVLNYTSQDFYGFFLRYEIDIYDDKYGRHGNSKAKRMRAFWEFEPDLVVGKVLSELLDVYQVNCRLGIGDAVLDERLLEESRRVVDRLLGREIVPPSSGTDDDFLNREFKIPGIHKLPVKGAVSGIVENRLDEARLAMKARAYLSVVILCGSILEAVLLGAAHKDPDIFNSAPLSPKSKDGKVRAFHEWTLAQFIDVACAIDLLKPDVKKFSHGLRDFRNYIHPYEQLASGFTPDEYTARVCFQVMKAALASVAGER